ncbi:MAG TPA: methyltransferase domain-containing protein [Acidobacteriaceae bacterium]|jgi:SAM-dependent methyltransferase|nr:methyltransferase domain-containing protein [Acidobacteriaceae bacterium]
MSHSEQIVDQFTRQAAQFARSPGARSQDILQTILRLAQPRPHDSALDVACGPGVLACELAQRLRHATAIDLTPAMLDQARNTQHDRGVANVTWDLGDVTALPYAHAAFDIVTCRFAFHHFPEPLPVLREMKRVCRPDGRIVIADTAPSPAKADAFNAMERLRDPSHARALPEEDWLRLFAGAGLPMPHLESARLAMDLEEFLARSYPHQGDELRIRAMFEAALANDTLDVRPYRQQQTIRFSVPVAILSVQIPYGG